MISVAELTRARHDAAELFERAGLGVTTDEVDRIEAADFGLSDLARQGAQILTWVQTSRIGVKLIALTPWQALPEHWHPPVGDDPGKEETIRVVWGTLIVGTAGPDNLAHARLPQLSAEHYTLRHEVVLGEGDQMEFDPGTAHWFQGGSSGVVLYSFSTVARDILDRFTDPNISRQTTISDKEQSS